MFIPQKLLKGENNKSDAEDRISNLPASLVHHILSFVDTRNAARTSVLSKRWKYIWRSIPILDFRYMESSQVHKFIDFVDKTLELHDESNIQQFTLCSDVRLNDPRFKKWVSTVIRHNVEDLCLMLSDRDPVVMPKSLYTCESLITLTLNISLYICFPRYTSFPRLETLVLSRIEFIDECWNKQFFSSCPVLQSLWMRHCTWCDTKRFCISNPSLKNLGFFNYDYEEGEEGLRNCSLEIHAPSLEVLIYIGWAAKDYALSSFPKLGDAHIDFFFDEYGAMSEGEIDYVAGLSKFLRALAHVANLTITDRTLQVLSADDLLNNLPSFQNLHNLCVTQKVSAGKALIALLGAAPNLASLEFEGFASCFLREEDNDDTSSDDEAGSEDNGDSEDDGWALDMVARRCFFLHLNSVSYKRFTGAPGEMRWVKLILKNAKALQTLVISFDSISHGKSKKLMEDISSLPRASAGCVFKFSS